MCALGLFISFLTEPIIALGNNALSTIKKIWKEKYLSIFDNIDYYQNPKKYDIKKLNKKIRKEHIICFLKIDNKTIPNIGYDNNNKFLYTRLYWFFDKVPYWFMIIWVILALYAFKTKSIFPNEKIEHQNKIENLEMKIEEIEKKLE